MNVVNSCCPPASVQRFIALEAGPKIGLAIICLVASTALGVLTIYLFGGGDFIKEEGSGFAKCTLYTMVGMVVAMGIGVTALGIYKGIDHCRKKFLDWREYDINHPTPNGNAIEMTETTQPV